MCEGPLAVVLPRMDEVGDPQVRDGEPGDAGLAAGAASRRRLVADLATGARRRAREGRDRGGVVVGLHLHHESPPARARGRVPSWCPAPERTSSPRARAITAALSRYADRTIARAARLRVADHVEQRPFAPDRRRSVQEALKILWRQCSEFTCANIISSASVGSRPSSRYRARGGSRSRSGLRARRREALASSSAPRASVPNLDRRVGRRRSVQEKRLRRRRPTWTWPRPRRIRPRRPARAASCGHGASPTRLPRSRCFARVAAGLRDRPRDAALDAGDAFQGAVTGDVGGLARPWRRSSPAAASPRSRRSEPYAAGHAERTRRSRRRSIRSTIHMETQPLRTK